MGAGNTKNRRGAGGRGGRGRAGTNKHRFHTAGRLKPRLYRMKVIVPKMEAIALGKLDSMLEELVAKGKVKKEGDKFIVDRRSGLGKVLSEGNATHKIVLKINASKGAIAKITKAGGKFEYAKKNFVQEEVALGDDDEDLEFEAAEEDKE
jgi:large subunit ribosomal protein L15